MNDWKADAQCQEIYIEYTDLFYIIANGVTTRVRPRFFDQVGHETMYASSGNKHFSLNPVIVRPNKIMNRADKNWAQF